MSDLRILTARRFRFRLLPFLAAVLVAAIGVSLGEWQRGRAVSKETLAAHGEAQRALPPIELPPLPGLAGEEPPAEFRRVRAQGEFVEGWTVFLENRPHRGQSGFHVLTPLRLAGSDDWVIVLRGWLPRDPSDRARVPKFTTPQGRVALIGEVRRDAGKVMQLGQPTEIAPRALLQNFDPAAFARASKHVLPPFIIAELGDAQDGLVRDWPAPSAGSDKHRGYAFQWYGLAAAALLFFIVTGFRRENHDAG